MITDFERRLVDAALGQHARYHGFDENDPALATQIEAYWTALALPFPGVETPWSGVFVCWCLKQAGATSRDFAFSARHAIYVKWAIANAEAGVGQFRALPVANCPPVVGDIVQNNRGNAFDYAHAADHDDYPSHCAIVVEVGSDRSGPYAITIGGNESDSIRRKRITLDAQGLIVQRTRDPYICVIQTLR